MIQKPERIVIHCSASPNGKSYPIEQMTKDHIARGFETIGYHFLIQPDGTAEVGRPLNMVGAHVEGHNTGSIGICMVGTDKFTQAQWDALRYKLDGVMLTYSLAKTEIYCHYQFDTAIKQCKTCPNIPINVILCWYYKISGEPVIAPYKLII